MATVAKSSIAPTSTPTHTNHPSTETPAMSQLNSHEHAGTHYPSHHNRPFPSSLLQRRKSSIDNLKAEEAEIASEINTHWPDASFIHHTTTIDSTSTKSHPLPISADFSPHSALSNPAIASEEKQSNTSPPQTQPHQPRPQAQPHEYPYRRSSTTSSLGSPGLDMHDSILTFTDPDGRYDSRSKHYNFGEEGHFHHRRQQYHELQTQHQQLQNRQQHQQLQEQQHQQLQEQQHQQLQEQQQSQPQHQQPQHNQKPPFPWRRASTSSSLNSASPPASGLNLHDSILTFTDADGHYDRESEHHNLGEEGHFHHEHQRQQQQQHRRQ